MSGFDTCADLDEVADEVALGSINGVDRARALAHLGSCARCRRAVDELTRTGEALLLLAPEEDPPLGFEARVAAAAAAAAGGAAPRTRRWWRAGAAAAAMLVVAGILGVVATNLGASDARRAGVRVALAAADGGRATCRAVIIPGHPSQLVVTIDEPPDSDTSDYTVEMQTSPNRPAQAVGLLSLVDGHGVLSTPLGAPGDAVRAVRVFQSGQLRYEARF